MGTSLVNDVSVLELSEDVVYSPDVYPVCLQETEEVPAEDCTVTGWGYLQQGKVYIQDQLRREYEVKYQCECQAGYQPIGPIKLLTTKAVSH